MINWTRVDEVRADMGDAFGDLVEAFLDEMDEGMRHINQSATPAILAAALHFLKGAALNLGFASFADLCARGESLANAGKAPAFDAAALRQCYTLSRAAFLAGLARRAA